MSKKWTVLFTDKYKNVNHPMIRVCMQASILKPQGNFHVNPLKTSQELYLLHQENLAEFWFSISDYNSFFFLKKKKRKKKKKKTLMGSFSLPYKDTTKHNTSTAFTQILSILA